MLKSDYVSSGRVLLSLLRKTSLNAQKVVSCDRVRLALALSDLKELALSDWREKQFKKELCEYFYFRHDLVHFLFHLPADFTKIVPIIRRR